MKKASFLYKTSSTHAQSEAGVQSSVDVFLQEIKKDLENLLNNRRQPFSLPFEFKELNSCVLEYGLEDFSYTLSFSQINLQKIATDIEKTLCLFEPRLFNIKVEMVNDNQDRKKQALFKITASLNMGRKAFSIYSHLNFHLQNQIYRFLNWNFDYAG